MTEDEHVEVCPSGAEVVAYWREMAAKRPGDGLSCGPDRGQAVLEYIDGLIAGRQVAEGHVEQLVATLEQNRVWIDAERRRQIHELAAMRDQLHDANRRLLEFIEARP